jgi:hypothetical protein
VAAVQAGSCQSASEFEPGCNALLGLAATQRFREVRTHTQPLRHLTCVSARSELDAAICPKEVRSMADLIQDVNAAPKSAAVPVKTKPRADGEARQVLR